MRVCIENGDQGDSAGRAIKFLAGWREILRPGYKFQTAYKLSNRQVPADRGPVLVGPLLGHQDRGSGEVGKKPGWRGGRG